MKDYGTKLRLKLLKQIRRLKGKSKLMQGAFHDQGTVPSH